MFNETDDVRHENSSNDLQTTCRNLEMKLRENEILREEENDAHRTEIADLKTKRAINEGAIEKLQTKLEVSNKEIKKMQLTIEELQAEIKQHQIQPQKSFLAMLEDVKPQQLPAQPGEKLSSGDTSRIDNKLLKKSVSSSEEAH